MSRSTPPYPVAWPASVWCSALRLCQGSGWDQCWETSTWLVLGNEQGAVQCWAGTGESSADSQHVNGRVRDVCSLSLKTFPKAKSLSSCEGQSFCLDGATKHQSLSVSTQSSHGDTSFTRVVDL